MIPSHLKTKSCRLCLYYEGEQNFCAVAPAYIGQAHLCADFELGIELEEEEEPQDLKRFIYEQFNKNFTPDETIASLGKLLEVQGELDRAAKREQVQLA